MANFIQAKTTHGNNILANHHAMATTTTIINATGHANSNAGYGSIVSTNLANDNDPMTVHHHLFHPNSNCVAFPYMAAHHCLCKRKIPKSSYVQDTHKENKLYISFLIYAAILFPFLLFCIALRVDLDYSYRVHQVNAWRNCEVGVANENCTSLPAALQYGDGYYVVPLRNATVKWYETHYSMVGSGEVIEYYNFGNVTVEDFCKSSTSEKAQDCFKSSFPSDSNQGTLFILEGTENAMIMNKSTTNKDQLFDIDNSIYKIKFEKPTIKNDILAFANMVVIGLMLSAFTLMIIAVVICSMVLKGDGLSKFWGRYALNRNEEERSRQFYTNVVSTFNERVIHQDSLDDKENQYLDVRAHPQYLFTTRSASTQLSSLEGGLSVHPNEKDCLKPLQLIASQMEEGEEILSYEQLTKTYEKKATKEDDVVFTIPFHLLHGCCAVALGTIGFLVFGWFSPAVCLLISFEIMLLSFALKRSNTKVHYLLTNRQFMAVEISTLYISMFCIELENIRNIWARQIPNTIERVVVVDRNELLVDLGNGGEDYNRGIIATHVTDPHYYIDTITQLQQNRLHP